MKKQHMIICGWCYPQIKDVLPTRILGGCQSKDRCAFCGRLVEYNAYVVEVGDEDAENNARRPANFKKEVS